MLAYIFLTIFAMVTAHPSFIAVPADQIAFVDLNSLRRAPRQTQNLQTPAPPQPRVYEQDQYNPLPVQIQQQIQQRPRYFPAQQQQGKSLVTLPPIQDTTSQTQHVVTLTQPQTTTQILRQKPTARYERPPDFGEYIDFGAHTGESGAFGWYADYPLEVSNREESGAY